MIVVRYMLLGILLVVISACGDDGDGGKATPTRGPTTTATVTVASPTTTATVTVASPTATPRPTAPATDTATPRPTPTEQPTATPEQVTGEFLALSYNVAGLPDELSGSMPATFTSLISPILNGYDFVLVQESWQTPDPNPLAPLRVYHEILVADADHPYKSEPAPHPLGADPRRPMALISDGLNRFSRFPFAEVVRESWGDCFNSAADCLAFKGFSVARTTFAEAVEVDVYNLHMEAGGEPEDDVLRAQGLAQLAEFIRGFSAERAVIVGGDFNLHTDQQPDSTQFQQLLMDAGLTDVCASLNCPEPGRIDKFLYRSNDTVRIEARSWQFEVDVFVTDDGQPLSDHDALAVRFAWAADVGR